MIRATLMAMVTVATLSMSQASATETVILRLKNAVYRGAVPVLIKDVFAIEASSAAQVDAIGQTPVVWQLANGWNQTTDLVQKLKASMSVADTTLTVAGGDRVWLTLCQPLSSDAITAAVTAQLQQQLSQQSQTLRLIEIKPLSDLHDQCFPLDQRVSTTQINNMHYGQTRFSSTHQMSEGGEFQLWWHGVLEQYAPVALQSLPAKTTITAQTVRFDWVKLGNGGREQPLTQQSLALWRSSKAIQAGTVLNESNSEKIPAIEKGEQVTMIYQQQGIRIESAAKALSAGQIDDEIWILVEQAKGPVKAKIGENGVVYAML